MYRSYGPKTQRPVLLARAAEERANRELDSRLERQDRERQEQFNSMIAASHSQKGPAQLAAETAELARLDAARNADYERHHAWLERRRLEQMTSPTLGT
jgi:hypothetical protein